VNIALLDATQELTITEAHLEKLPSHVTNTIEHRDPGAQKGLLQALVARIEVESRAAVRPYLRVPRGRRPDRVEPLRQRRGPTTVRISRRPR
jgi:hypothetical protein